LSIITDMFRDARERQRAIGFWAGTSGVGFALGPIVGGLLLARFWWGSVFLINVPIALAGLLCAITLVPDSKNAAAQRPDFAGALLSIAGLALVLWSIIETPVRGWTSLLVIGTGLSGLVVLAVFGAWERASSHPMLNLRFFRSRSFSGAISSTSMVMFGLVGSLFLLTQFLQFELGYSALQAGVRMLPVAAAMVLIAPSSTVVVRIAGTKLTVAAGLLMIAAGFWQVSQASVTPAYTAALPGMIMIGIGAALVIPSATASVMGSLPRGDTGVGSATNGVAIQVGGALGVAIIGSLLSTRYQDRMTGALASFHLPAGIERSGLGSTRGPNRITGYAPGQRELVVGHAQLGAARSAGLPTAWR